MEKKEVLTIGCENLSLPATVRSVVNGLGRVKIQAANAVVLKQIVENFFHACSKPTKLLVLPPAHGQVM
jgi:hypothetical protein